jgi:hypothetical protein
MAQHYATCPRCGILISWYEGESSKCVKCGSDCAAAPPEASGTEQFKRGDRVEIIYSSEHYTAGELGTVIGIIAGVFVSVALDNPRWVMLHGQKVQSKATAFIPSKIRKVPNITPSA